MVHDGSEEKQVPGACKMVFPYPQVYLLPPDNGAVDDAVFLDGVYRLDSIDSLVIGENSRPVATFRKDIKLKEGFQVFSRGKGQEVERKVSQQLPEQIGAQGGGGYSA